MKPYILIEKYHIILESRSGNLQIADTRGEGGDERFDFGLEFGSIKTGHRYAVRYLNLRGLWINYIANLFTALSFAVGFEML